MPGRDQFSERVLYGDIIEHFVQTITELAGQPVLTAGIKVISNPKNRRHRGIRPFDAFADSIY